MTAGRHRWDAYIDAPTGPDTPAARRARWLLEARVEFTRSAAAAGEYIGDRYRRCTIAADMDILRRLIWTDGTTRKLDRNGVAGV